MPAAPIFGAIGAVTSGIGAIGQIGAARAQGKALGEIAEEQARRAEPTIEEIQSIERAIATSRRTLERSEKILNAMDPGLVAAGKELHRLLEGGEAASLGPVKRQRQEQRRSLVNSLRQRGIVEGSTAYSQAINDFDAETSDVLNRAQQGRIDTFLQTSLSTRQSAQQGQAAFAGLGAELLNRIAERRISAAGGSAQRRFLEQKGSFAGFKGLQDLGGVFGGLGKSLKFDPTFGQLFPPTVPDQELTLSPVEITGSDPMGPHFDPLSPGVDIRVERGPASIGGIFEQS